MKRLIKNIVLGLVSTALLLGTSKAETYITNSVGPFTDTLVPTTTEWNHIFQVQAFDPSLGSLVAVYVEVTEDVNVSGYVENTAATPASFFFRSGSLLTVTLPGMLGFLQPNPLAVSQSYTGLAPGASAPYGPASASESVDNTYYTPLSGWTGAGKWVKLPAYTLTDERITGGGGNIIAAMNTVAGATVKVTYYYIPEPGSVALLALGGVVLLLRRRR